MFRHILPLLLLFSLYISVCTFTYKRRCTGARLLICNKNSTVFFNGTNFKLGKSTQYNSLENVRGSQLPIVGAHCRFNLVSA